MQLNVNDTIVEKPGAEDIARALGAKSFPDGWYIALESENDASLDAVLAGGGAFTLTYADDNTCRRQRHITAAAVQVAFVSYLGGDAEWDRDCRWEVPAKGGAAKPRFVPAKATTSLMGDKGGEPPTWAVAVIVGIVGSIVVMSMLGQWEEGSFLRSHVTGANTTSFYVVLIALPVIALLALATGVKLWELRKAQSWPQTTGTIVRSEVEARRQGVGEDATIVNAPAVEYDFMAGALKVRGRRIGIGDDSGGENTEATLARYPKGATVTVYYDPADPAHCVLERGGPAGLTAKGCVGALVSLAVFGGVVYWLIAYGPVAIDAHFPKANSPVVLFATGFGLFALMFFIAARRNSKRAANWPSVPGTIVRSAVESYCETTDGRTRTFYRPAVEFSYRVNGHTYAGNQIRVGMTVSGSQRYAEAVVATYPIGSACEVHYDPANPGNAALENPTGATWIVAALAAAMFALAVWQLGLFK